MMAYRGSSIRPSVPKPYDFVPVAGEIKRLKVPGHDQVVYDAEYFSGRLTFEMHTLSPVFISNGRYALSEELGLKPGLAVRGCYRLGGQPVIPASSLKGLVRNVAEAVSPSCVTLTRADKDLLPRKAANTDNCRIGPDEKGHLQEACPACALFGGGGKNAHIGLVRFEDVRLAEGGQTEMRRLVPLYGPRVTFRQTPRAYLDSRGNFKGRKFYFHGQTAQVSDTEGDLCEVIPEGAKLAGSLTFINLEASLLGVLFFALGLDGTFKLKLGGGKPACFGSIEIVPGELWQDQGTGFTQAERGGDILIGETLTQLVEKQVSLAEGRGWLLKPQMTKLREILHFPNPRECPTGLY